MEGLNVLYSNVDTMTWEKHLELCTMAYQSNVDIIALVEIFPKARTNRETIAPLLRINGYSSLILSDKLCNKRGIAIIYKSHLKLVRLEDQQMEEHIKFKFIYHNEDMVFFIIYRSPSFNNKKNLLLFKAVFFIW